MFLFYQTKSGKAYFEISNEFWKCFYNDKKGCLRADYGVWFPNFDGCVGLMELFDGMFERLIGMMREMFNRLM
jgi:hypothetical protein